MTGRRLVTGLLQSIQDSNRCAMENSFTCGGGGEGIMCPSLIDPKSQGMVESGGGRRVARMLRKAVQDALKTVDEVVTKWGGGFRGATGSCVRAQPSGAA